MDNRASVLIPKFAGLREGWLGILRAKERLTCTFIIRKNRIFEVFCFSLCGAYVLHVFLNYCAVFVFRGERAERCNSFLKLLFSQCTSILNAFFKHMTVNSIFLSSPKCNKPPVLLSPCSIFHSAFPSASIILLTTENHLLHHMCFNWSDNTVR